MGKFVEEKAVIENYLDSYVSQTHDFSKYIEGSPTFVTYYSKDVLASTEDIHLQGVMDTIGAESPLKYNRIENFPIYGIEAMTPTVEFGESGLDTSVQGGAVVLPNTIKPLPNDYFLVGDQGEGKLFRVNDVETDNAGTRVIYRISYNLSSDKTDILEERQVTDTYKVVYENIGKNAKSVILETDFLFLEQADEAYDKLWKFYQKFFYNEDFNAFLYQDRIYDNMLARFISDHSLFVKTRTFLRNIMVEPLLDETQDEFFQYDSTIFYALEEMEVDSLEEFNYRSEKIGSAKSALSLFRNKYEVGKLIRTEDPGQFPIFGSSLVDIISGKEKPPSELLGFVADYLNGTLEKEQLINHVENARIRVSLENYILVPCILFMIKEIVRRILNK
jgi:hypothetical protein